MTSRNPKSVRVARSRSGVIALIFTCALVVLAQWWYQDHFHATLRGEYIAYSPEVLDKIGAAAIFSETSSFSVSSIATENNWQLGWGDPWLKQASWWDRPAFYSKGSRRWPRRVVFLTQRRATASVSVPQLSESESQSLNALEAFDYDPTRGVLSYTGRMDESQFRDALAVNKSLDYRSAVERLFYHSSGNGLATVDDRNISTLPRSEFAELGETINKNVNGGAIPLTVSNVEWCRAWIFHYSWNGCYCRRCPDNGPAGFIRLYQKANVCVKATSRILWFVGDPCTIDNPYSLLFGI